MHCVYAAGGAAGQSAMHAGRLPPGQGALLFPHHFAL